MNSFTFNQRTWRICYVDPDSIYLVDRTGRRTVATTDPSTGYVYLSTALSGDFLIRVLIHEMGHCVLVSYGLLNYLHRMVRPEFWIEAEEWVCNFIADYGLLVFRTLSQLIGYNAIRIVPYELDRMIA